MNRPDNDLKTDDNRREENGKAAGAIEGRVFLLLRRILGRDGRQGGRAVVTEATTGTVKAVVACLGASATDATGSYDWIRDLALRPNNASLRFYRFAEGGDLAYNGLQRLPDIVNCHPDYVIVLLGDNDVLALISKKVAQFDRLTKHRHQVPLPIDDGNHHWLRDRPPRRSPSRF